MKRIGREIKELVEASEAGMTLVVCGQDESVDCPVVAKAPCLIDYQSGAKPLAWWSSPRRVAQ